MVPYTKQYVCNTSIDFDEPNTRGDKSLVMTHLGSGSNGRPPKLRADAASITPPSLVV